MTGPVFVLDRQGQPLMPVAPAHARKLLQRGTAQLLPHPTLSILQLNRDVERPILRPIMLGLTIHQTTAELVIIAAGQRSILPLMTIVSQLSWVSRRWDRWKLRWRLPRRPHQPWLRISTIGAIIGALWRLLPLSHIVILRLPALYRVRPGWRRSLLRYLRVNGIQVAISYQKETPPAGVPKELYAALVSFVRTPPRYSLLVGVAFDPLTPKLQPLINAPLTDAPDTGVIDVPSLPLVGIIDPKSIDEAPVLQVPIAATVAGVTWRYVPVPPDTPFQRWLLTPVVFLPLVSPAVQRQIMLYDNFWDTVED